MSWLSDRTVGRLRDVVEWPDLEGSRYEVRERIAQGGMGVVYRAADRDLERDVALKVLQVPRLDDAAKRRMLREAKILARLEHPGIVPVHDVGFLPDERVYYTMKLVKGDRFDDWERAHRGIVDRLRVFERICEPVAFAHAHGVIHRDLKPENVMVGAFGEVLVMDWGVAKILDAAETHAPDSGSTAPEPAAAEGEATVAGTAGPAGETNPGTILGTPGYMAPEQAEGRSDLVGRPADVYALGVILRDLLDTADGPIAKPLRAVVERATANDPADRYASVEELAAEIPRFLADRTVSAYREAFSERIGRMLHRYRTPILLVLFYVVIRLLILVFAGT